MNRLHLRPLVVTWLPLAAALAACSIPPSDATSTRLQALPDATQLPAGRAAARRALRLARLPRHGRAQHAPLRQRGAASVARATVPRSLVRHARRGGSGLRIGRRPRAGGDERTSSRRVARTLSSSRWSARRAAPSRTRADKSGRRATTRTRASSPGSRARRDAGACAERPGRRAARGARPTSLLQCATDAPGSAVNGPTARAENTSGR